MGGWNDSVFISDFFLYNNCSYYLFFGFTDIKIEAFYKNLEDYKQGKGTK